MAPLLLATHTASAWYATAPLLALGLGAAVWRRRPGGDRGPGGGQGPSAGGRGTGR